MKILPFFIYYSFIVHLNIYSKLEILNFHIFVTSTSHYGTFVFIIICYLTPSLTVIHSYHDETILILDIKKRNNEF
jgi:hypothetical protein